MVKCLSTEHWTLNTTHWSITRIIDSTTTTTIHETVIHGTQYILDPHQPHHLTAAHTSPTVAIHQDHFFASAASSVTTADIKSLDLFFFSRSKDSHSLASQDQRFQPDWMDKSEFQAVNHRTELLPCGGVALGRFPLVGASEPSINVELQVWGWKNPWEE